MLVAGSVVAQDIPADDTRSLDACVAMESDALRLACYDTVAGRDKRTPVQADAAAERARQYQEQADRGRLNLFRSDPQTPTDQRVDAALANAGKGSLLDSRWELARDSKLGLFNFRAYKPVYLFPVFWTAETNTRPHSPNPDNTASEHSALDRIEAKFQISFKTKVVENLLGDNGDIWTAYTQSSRWQVYNGEESRPFRETSYEPEVMLAFRTGYSLLGWKGRLAAVGINHQSNGREDPYSRSWNRVVFNIGLDREGWALNLRPWIRISDGNDDDNPDISDYMGRGDATLVRVLPNGHQFSLGLRHSLRGGDRSHGAVQFDWAFPLLDSFRGHLQVFDGYGESMIDYNHRTTYVGLGISLMEWY
ncbi:MAG: phospholipase A [Pseudomonadota bacterium]|nr:phospholipase A [Pseudomonadota bacterium]